MSNRDAGPNDSELLTRIGLVPTANAMEGEAVVSVPERAAHLSEVLNHFDAVVVVEEDIAKYRNLEWRRDQQQQFGNAAVYQMQERERGKRQQILDATLDEFKAGYGLSRLIENGLGDQDQLNKDVAAQYADFTREFRGSTAMRFEKRRLMRQFFKQQIAGGTEETTLVESNQTEHVTEPEESDGPEVEYPEADTFVKLIGLRDDSRAGFLPTTHREKSQGYELLSYMEPGRYAKGISTRLDDIFFRQQREMQKKGMTPREGYEVAADSVRSVIREWGDYLADARSSWIKLAALGRLIDSTPNQRLSLEDLLNDEGHGETLSQLIRHHVLQTYRDQQKPIGFDPLWVREDRTNPTEEKHKTVEDMFTHKDEEFMAAYIRRRAQELTVGDVRNMAIEAIADQLKRGEFWRNVLESVNEDYGQYAELALQRIT